MNTEQVIEKIDAALPLLKLILPKSNYILAAEQLYKLVTLPKSELKEKIDAIFDDIEDYVKDSSNKIDDVLVLPVISGLRRLLNVPDSD